MCIKILQENKTHMTDFVKKRKLKIEETLEKIFKHKFLKQIFLENFEI